MLQMGDHVRVTEKYPAHNLLRWHVGRIRSMKVSHISHTNDFGVVYAITLNYDEDPSDGEGGLVFYDYELEKIE